MFKFNIRDKFCVKSVNIVKVLFKKLNLLNFQEPKPKRVNLSIPSDAEEREKCLEGIKQQWRDIHARKTARKNRR